MIRQRGFTLIEVLIAMLLVSIALLGLAKLQTFGLKQTGSSYFRTQATTFLNDMAERVRLNPGAAYSQDRGESCIGRVSPKSCLYSAIDNNGCAADELAAYDLYEVSCGSVGSTDGNNGLGLDELLPNGQLHIHCPVAEQCNLAIYWQEASVAGGPDNAIPKMVSMVFFR